MKQDFATKTKIIETISLKVSNEVETKEVNVSKEAFNVYISGIDIFGDISLVSRSDVNMIMTVNPNTHQILLTSIPRDYYVQLHNTTGYKDKLTHAGIYGVDMSVKTIEDLLDININYYARVNFTTLISLVDAIDGIDIYSNQSFVAQDGTTFKKGMNHLNGTKALSFARERHAFKDGDRQRGKNQQAVITAIIDKVMSSRTLVTKYTTILETLGKSFQTNIDTSKIYELVNMQLDKMPNWEIDSISLDGTDSSNYTYSYKLQKLYVMEPNMDTVRAARDQINAITNAKE
jgi:LCP family protein required for cell wall assembly